MNEPMPGTFPFQAEGSAGNIPVLVYDAGCAFCSRWAERWRRRTGTQLRYVSIGEAREKLSVGQCAACEQAIHLFTPDGEIYRGAAAILRVWALAGWRRWLLWTYENVPGVAVFAEAVYRLVARHRLRLPGGGA
jgi:predicted DCC family thiol-disulfide oxidoreductase YuxK